jgi:putative ABC transport system ATP-binding protein
MSENNSLIHVSHIVKTYEMGDVEVHALRGVSLDVYRGEFIAIMGASGSGKSTFMNIMGCLNVGKLSRDSLARIRNEKIGFVFQGFNLLSRTSALENVELPMFYRSLSNKTRREKAMESLRIVGLEDRWHHMPNQLSGGQQQRVAIARALVNDPSIILADEPTGNLDSRTSVEVMEIFQHLNEKGITIMLVTHELDIAEFAKRNVVFKDGRVKKDFSVVNRRVAMEQLKAMPVGVDEEEEEAA